MIHESRQWPGALRTGVASKSAHALKRAHIDLADKNWTHTIHSVHFEKRLGARLQHKTRLGWGKFGETWLHLVHSINHLYGILPIPLKYTLEVIRETVMSLLMSVQSESSLPHASPSHPPDLMRRPLSYPKPRVAVCTQTVYGNS